MKKHFFITVVLLLFICTARVAAQETDTISNSITANDTIIIFQPGTEQMEIETIKLNSSYSSFVPNPRRAAWYAAVCPGLGQIYNRKYWKLPIVYGAFVGLAYGISWNGQYYSDYKQAYIDFVDDNPDTNSWKAMLPAGVELTEADYNWYRGVLQQKKDSYRRNRDLCIIGVVGVYVLTILDAFVDAQLYEFDISPDLTLNVQPQVHTSERNTLGFGVHCQLNF